MQKQIKLDILFKAEGIITKTFVFIHCFKICLATTLWSSCI